MASAYLIIVSVRAPTEHWMNARNGMLRSALGTPPNIEGSEGTLPRIPKFGIIFGIIWRIPKISEKNVLLPVILMETRTLYSGCVRWRTCWGSFWPMSGWKGISISSSKCLWTRMDAESLGHQMVQFRFRLHRFGVERDVCQCLLWSTSTAASSSTESQWNQSMVHILSTNSRCIPGIYHLHTMYINIFVSQSRVATTTGPSRARPMPGVCLGWCQPFQRQQQFHRPMSGGPIGECGCITPVSTSFQQK